MVVDAAVDCGGLIGLSDVVVAALYYLEQSLAELLILLMLLLLDVINARVPILALDDAVDNTYSKRQTYAFCCSNCLLAYLLACSQV